MLVIRKPKASDITNVHQKTLLQSCMDLDVHGRPAHFDSINSKKKIDLPANSFGFIFQRTLWKNKLCHKFGAHETIFKCLSKWNSVKLLCHPSTIKWSISTFGLHIFFILSGLKLDCSVTQTWASFWHKPTFFLLCALALVFSFWHLFTVADLVRSPIKCFDFLLNKSNFEWKDSI